MFHTLCQKDQDKKVCKISYTGNQLCRNQCNFIWCKRRIVERNSVPCICLTPITASCKEASDSSKSLCKCDGRNCKIKVSQNIYLLYLCINVCSQNPSDDPAIYNKSFGYIQQQRWIFDDLLDLCQIEQQLCPENSRQQSPGSHIENRIRV